MNVFIADKLPDWCAERVKGMGASTVVQTGLKGAELADAVAQVDADVLIVRSTKVTSEVLDAAPALSLIIRAGAGVDTIDHGTDMDDETLNLMAEKGIYWVRPTSSSTSTRPSTRTWSGGRWPRGSWPVT